MVGGTKYPSIRLRDDVEELVRIMSKRLRIPPARVRNYAVLLGLLELIEYSKNKKVIPLIDWRVIKSLTNDVREAIKTMDQG